MKILRVVKSTEAPISPNVLWLDKKTLKALTSSGWEPIAAESIGGITGPTSSVVDNFVIFGDENGTIVKDSGVSPSDLVGKFDPISVKYGEIFNSYYTGNAKDPNGFGNNVASGLRAHAEGGGTTASGDYSHAEGEKGVASGRGSHVEGLSNKAIGQYSHAEGWLTTAKGSRSHAEGYNTTASGDKSHVEGENNVASGQWSHAEGYNTTASSDGSHAEGSFTKALNPYSHAEGLSTKANGNQSHAEGWSTEAKGNQSHAEGYKAIANGDRSHAEGEQTTTTNNWEHAQGLMNVSNTGTSMSQKTLHSVGVGMMKEPYTNRNAHEIMCNGDHYVYGLGGYDGTNYAEAKTLQEVVGDCYQDAGINTKDNDNGIELFFRAQEAENTFYIPLATHTDPGLVTSEEKICIENSLQALNDNYSKLTLLDKSADLAAVITKCNQILGCLRSMSTV